MSEGERERIEITVGRHLLDNPRKEDLPLPEFTYGEPFELVVHWTRDSDASLSLELSHFRLLVLDLGGSPLWQEDNTYGLQLRVDGRPVSEFRFACEGPGSSEERTVQIDRNPVGEKRRELLPQLVLFRQAILDEVFVVDPPWVGKPPIG